MICKCHHKLTTHLFTSRVVHRETECTFKSRTFIVGCKQTWSLLNYNNILRIICVDVNSIGCEFYLYFISMIDWLPVTVFLRLDIEHLREYWYQTVVSVSNTLKVNISNIKWHGSKDGCPCLVASSWFKDFYSFILIIIKGKCYLSWEYAKFTLNRTIWA